MKDASVESARFEPTVFGAVRRYRIMVAVFALAGLVAAIGYTLHKGKAYAARASVSVPTSQGGQSIDSAGTAPGVASRRPASGQHRRRHIA